MIIYELTQLQEKKMAPTLNTNTIAAKYWITSRASIHFYDFINLWNETFMRKKFVYTKFLLSS